MDSLYSIEEWVEYISKIEQIDLIDHAKYIGSRKFQTEMTSEGYTANEIYACHQALVKRFLETDTRVPAQMEGGVIDYQEMADALED